MTVMEHLGELRTRLIISLVAFVAVSVLAFIFYSPILEFLRDPLCSVDRRRLGPQGCDLIYTGVLGGFQFRLKLTAIVGIAASSPIWLYQIWAFIVPALTRRERGYAFPFLASSVLLFLVGASLAYFTLPTGLRLLLSLGGDELVPFLRAEEYLNFLGLMLVAFGVTFELPLVLVFLGLAEVITVEQLRSSRKIAIVVIVALSAVVTPSQDPYTLLALSVPLYVLYEATILILRAMLRRRARREQR